MRFVSVVIAALVFGSIASPSKAAQLLVNGGFELGNFNPDPNDPAGRYDTIRSNGPQDLTGWSVGLSMVPPTQGQQTSLVWGVNPIDINPRTGSGFVDLTGIGNTLPHGHLNQTVATIAGQLYTFSIYLTQDRGNGPGGFTTIKAYANGVEFALSGTPGSWDDIAGHTATYGLLTGSFIADSVSTIIGIGAIQFAPPDRGGNIFMIGLDDASLIGPALAETPIPGALPLFASGLGVMGLLARHRKRKAASARAA